MVTYKIVSMSDVKYSDLIYSVSWDEYFAVERHTYGNSAFSFSEKFS
jgi:hypothetical protein